MPFYIDPNDLQNDDFQLSDENGDLILTHKATGATFKYDATDDGWVPSAPIGTANSKVPGTSHFTDTEHDSVSTGEASVSNAPSQDDGVLRWQEGVEVGGVTADGLDNSGGDDNWDQSEGVRVGESFSNAFESTPEIAASLDNDRDSTSATEYRHNIANKSATGFDVDFKQIAAVDNSGTTDAYGLSYVATEGR